ncbi:MAG: PQQ-dependent sugar dehydrogenase [Thiomicrospira sp.]|uniref:PQQ-dependent sugar dehydrogenase n=1 Tax=Thiomicrospira sp. TaxID=935 RepID=UPI0019E3E87A|nr:PQQ-dependent sugar dehydrogenase [Thiomicrospira sp.]MBE0494316.1 PQQ-dependent sugar dehydrogenase [Thiomicrospira sp.]
MHRFNLTFSFVCLVWLSNASAQTDFKIDTLTQGLGVVWGMTFISDNELVFTERSGRAGLFNLKNKQVHWLSGLPKVHAQGQGGLLDVQIGPNFAQDSWVYFTYSRSSETQPAESATTLARAKLEGVSLTEWQDLLVTQSASQSTQHYGSRIAFDNQGHVFFGIGDRGKRENGQIFTNHAASMIRLKLDGRLPKDNPFIGNADYLDELWSVGHRNPQGLVYDLERDILWEIEHGPRGGDELNIVKKGQNYGWPDVSQGKEYWGPVAIGTRHKPGMIDPVKVYTPSIAPSSLMLYQGNAFPDWKGHLFAGALVLRHLNLIELNHKGEVIGEQRLLEDLNERIRALTQDKNGLIYLSTDSGKIMRLRP